MEKLATMLLMLLIAPVTGRDALTQGLLATATAMMRVPSAGGGEAEFGLPQLLVVAGAVILVLLLAGLVIWRARRTSRGRSK